MKKTLLALALLLGVFANAQISGNGRFQFKRKTLAEATVSTDVLRHGEPCVVSNPDHSQGHCRIYVGDGTSTLAELITAGIYTASSLDVADGVDAANTYTNVITNQLLPKTGAGIVYSFNDATSNSPEVDGVAFNNTTAASITRVYISKVNSLAQDYDAYLDELTTGLLLIKNLSSTAYVSFKYTATTENFNTYSVTVEYLSGDNSLFTYGDLCSVWFNDFGPSGGGSSAFADLTGDPYDNTALSDALDEKADDAVVFGTESMVVAGAGTSSANGSYARNDAASGGSFEFDVIPGTPRYQKGDLVIIKIDATPTDRWLINDNALDIALYRGAAASDYASPSDEATWLVSDGSGPAPTVDEGTADTLTVQQAFDTLFTALEATGRTLWVDAVNGDNGTALSGRQDLPFLTLTAAKAAAVSGDLIHVRPGVYGEKNLLKDGVNWYFDDGAIVEYSGATDGSIFDDGPDGANGPVTCVVSGSGVFAWTNNFELATSHFGVVHVQEAESNVVISGKRIDQLGDNFQFGWSVLQENGLLKLDMTDGYFSPNGAYNVGWFGGTGWIDGPSIVSLGHCITWIGDATGGDFYVTAPLIESTGGDIAISSETEDGNGALWINSLLIKGESSSALISGLSGKVYITSQKVWNTNADAPVIGCQGFTLWLTAQKMTAESGSFFRCEASSGVVNLEVQQYESLLEGAPSGGYGSIYNEGADLTIIGGVMTIVNEGEAQKGLEHLSGTTRAKGLTIDSSGNDQTNSYTVNVGSAGLILDHCTLVAPVGCPSINAGSSQDVVSYDSYANTSEDPDVNIQGALNVGSFVK